MTDDASYVRRYDGVAFGWGAVTRSEALALWGAGPRDLFLFTDAGVLRYR